MSFMCLPNDLQWAFDHSVANTITLQGKETVFDDMIYTVDYPSEILCRWVALSYNSTSCLEPSATCLRVMCLLSRCIQKSSEFSAEGLEGIVPTLSNISSLIGLSIYIDCMWVEDCPYGYDHWTRIMRCSYKRMKQVERVFVSLLQYRVYVSDDEIKSLELKLNNTYKSHLLVTRQPLLNKRTAELTITCKRVLPEEAEDNLMCTEMSID